MNIDNILEIAIDGEGRLCIYPEKVKFTLIYRSAAEVHWDNLNNFLFSPRPKEWSYLDWYKHITLVAIDYGCKLQITSHTKWTSISFELKYEILKFEQTRST